MDKDELKYMLFASIISADNDEFNEDTKQKIISLYNNARNSDKKWHDYDWASILSPIKDETIIDRLVKLLTN